jgi:hypothetical protein
VVALLFTMRGKSEINMLICGVWTGVGVFKGETRALIGERWCTGIHEYTPTPQIAI